MKRAAALVVALLAASLAAGATTPSAQVTQAWIRWLPANLPVAGYATIHNDSDGTLRLDSASSPAYRMVMLHRSRLADADSRMEMVDHLDIAPHASATLAPGGYHFMLSEPTRTIHPGDKVPVTLQFAGGQVLQVDFSVLPANASGPAG